MGVIAQQVGPAGCRASARLLAPPSGDLRVISRQQNGRHIDSAKAGWPGVRWRAQAGARERFIFERAIAERAGLQANGSVDEGQRRNLATGQHEIAQRQLFGVVERDDPFVDAFIMPAHDDEPVQSSEPLGVGLKERPTGW